MKLLGSAEEEMDGSSVVDLLEGIINGLNVDLAGSLLMEELDKEKSWSPAVKLVSADIVVSSSSSSSVP